MHRYCNFADIRFEKVGLQLVTTSGKLKNFCFLIDTGATHNILFSYVYECF